MGLARAKLGGGERDASPKPLDLAHCADEKSLNIKQSNKERMERPKAKPTMAGTLDGESESPPEPAIKSEGCDG